MENNNNLAFASTEDTNTAFAPVEENAAANTPAENNAPAFAPAESTAEPKTDAPAFEPAAPAKTVKYKEAPSAFAEGLPEWSLEPPQVMVRRR